MRVANLLRSDCRRVFGGFIRARDTKISASQFTLRPMRSHIVRVICYAGMFDLGLKAKIFGLGRGLEAHGLGLELET